MSDGSGGMSDGEDLEEEDADSGSQVDNRKVVLDDFILLKVIGKGSFGKVAHVLFVLKLTTLADLCAFFCKGHASSYEDRWQNICNEGPQKRKHYKTQSGPPVPYFANIRM